MGSSTTYPGSASVYELLRTKPGARERLNAIGVTGEFLDHRIGDAARALGMSVERIIEAVEREPAAVNAD